MTFDEIAELRTEYRTRFGKECIPCSYEDGDEPDYGFTALVAQYCLSIDTPYEKVDRVGLESWLVEHGFSPSSVQSISWL